MQAPGETRSRGLASGAVVGVGASVLLFFVTMLTVMGGNPKVMAVIFWLSVVASYAAYATFSLFAGAVAKYQKQAGAQKQALLLAAVFGGLALLFSFLVYIPMLVTLKKTGNTVMQVFSNLWLFASVAALAWLAMITLEVRKGVRKRI